MFLERLRLIVGYYRNRRYRYDLRVYYGLLDDLIAKMSPPPGDVRFNWSEGSR